MRAKHWMSTDVFTPETKKRAVPYVEHEGYFGNNLHQIELQVKGNHVGILAKVNTEPKTPNANSFRTKGGRNYCMFLPFEKVMDYDFSN